MASNVPAQSIGEDVVVVLYFLFSPHISRRLAPTLVGLHSGSVLNSSHTQANTGIRIGAWDCLR